MRTADIIAIVVITVLSAIVVAMAIVMLTGRGANLLAGYNTLSKEEKEKYDGKKLAKFMGKIFLPIGLSFNLITVGVVIDFPWMALIVVGVVLGLIAFAVIYCNARGRFKK